MVSEKQIEALKDVLAHLVAAHSLLSRSPKTAAASDKMFDQMLADYQASIDRGRAALTAAEQAEPAPMYGDEQVIYTDPDGKVWHPHRGYWCWKVSHELAQAQKRVKELEAEPAPAARSGAVKADAETAREALRELASVQMNLSLEDWCRISNTILAALEPTVPATDAEPVVDFFHGMPPQDVIDAAQKLEHYFASKGIRQWKLCGVASWDNPHLPISRLREALAWYEEQARLCRLIHSGGDAGRNALAKDGGAKARAALTQETPR